MALRQVLLSVIVISICIMVCKNIIYNVSNDRMSPLDWSGQLLNLKKENQVQNVQHESCCFIFIFKGDTEFQRVFFINSRSCMEAGGLFACCPSPLHRDAEDILLPSSSPMVISILVWEAFQHGPPAVTSCFINRGIIYQVCEPFWRRQMRRKINKAFKIEMKDSVWEWDFQVSCTGLSTRRT